MINYAFEYRLLKLPIMPHIFPYYAPIILNLSSVHSNVVGISLLTGLSGVSLVEPLLSNPEAEL